MAVFTPKFVGQPDETTADALPRAELLKKALPIVGLIILVLGGIYTGTFTPVEAGAMGAIGALILSEPLPPSLLLAMGLILGGVGLSQYGAISRLINSVRARTPRHR